MARASKFDSNGSKWHCTAKLAVMALRSNSNGIIHSFQQLSPLAEYWQGTLHQMCEKY